MGQKAIIRNITLLIAAAGTANFTIAQAGEIQHFNGDITDARNYFLPGPGIYAAIYNYKYFSDLLNYSDSDKISSVILGTPSRPVPANVKMDIDVCALVPVINWISPEKILNGNHGRYIAPAFANNHLDADLSLATGAGGCIQNFSFGLSDLGVQPASSDRGEGHWDFLLASGSYTPVDTYTPRNVALPVAANVTVESKDDIGLGFWTRQARAGIAWYPMTNWATAVTAVGTYGYNIEEKEFDVRPGQMFTVNWGLSQYLPLNRNRALLLEIGPAGYDAYQVTDSTGGNALADSPRSHLHAAGGQLGLIYVPWNAFLTFHSFYEYSAGSSFQGASVGLNLGISF